MLGDGSAGKSVSYISKYQSLQTPQHSGNKSCVVALAPAIPVLEKKDEVMLAASRPPGSEKVSISRQ